jgi:hypothetical protein
MRRQGAPGRKDPGNMQLEKTVEKLKKINEIGRTLSSIIDTRELAHTVVAAAGGLLDARKAVLHLKESAGPPLTVLWEEGVVQPLPDFSPCAGADCDDLFTGGRTAVLRQNGSGQPCIGLPLKVKGEVIGAVLLEWGADGPFFADDEIELLSLLLNQAMSAFENAQLYQSLKNNYISMVQSLVNALEAIDRFTKGHSERVRMLSVELGKHLGLDFRQLELLEQAAILHDIGKILIPIERFEEVRKTIIQHHERHDGSGYPYGLMADEICLSARILSVVDTFDAMMTDRPYRKALSADAVKEEIRTNAGTQFDPCVAEAFVEMLDLKGKDFLSAAGYNTLFSPL